MTPTPGSATGERPAPRAHPPAAGPLARPAAQPVDHPDRPDVRTRILAPARESCPECAAPWVRHAEGCLTYLSRGWSACAT